MQRRLVLPDHRECLPERGSMPAEPCAGLSSLSRALSEEVHISLPFGTTAVVSSTEVFASCLSFACASAVRRPTNRLFGVLVVDVVSSCAEGNAPGIAASSIAACICKPRSRSCWKPDSCRSQERKTCQRHLEFLAIISKSQAHNAGIQSLCVRRTMETTGTSGFILNFVLSSYISCPP